MADRVYNGAWVRVRLSILNRDNHTCQIAGPTCTTQATEVDHIIPLTQGGARLDPRNLRAVCRSCHKSRQNTGSTLVVTHPDPPPSQDW